MLTREMWVKGHKLFAFPLADEAEKIFDALDFNRNGILDYYELIKLQPDLERLIDESEERKFAVYCSASRETRDKFQAAVQSKKSKMAEVRKAGKYFAAFTQFYFGHPMRAWALIDVHRKLEITKTEFFKVLSSSQNSPLRNG